MAKLVDDQLFGKDPDGRVVDPDLIDGGLRSKQFATVIDLLGYGEIDSIFDEGGAGTNTFRKSVFLDSTPIQNSSGDENFTNVDVFFKNGASNQTPLKEINAIEKTIAVGIPLTNSPFTTTKTGTYTLAGSGGQTVSGVTLGPNQMLVEISNHGYSVGEVIHWENTTATATVQTDNPQTQNILSVPDSGKFVVNTTFEDTSFQNGACTVKTSVGLSRTISDTNVDKVRVTIQFPTLQEFKTDGDIVGAEVKVSVRITENNGTVNNPVILDITNGRATSAYVKDLEIVFERTMNYPLTLSVFRNTEDGTDTRLQNTTNWLSYTEINTDTSAYQGFAYVALRFNAQEFQSFPRRMYRIKGTKIKVPHNTTVDSENGRVIYPDGYTFNGTFKNDKEWCSDPAWILYDLLTTDKGFGGTDGIVDEDTLDVFSFYSASAYASTLITDPITNTTEPRFSCNVILNRKNDAYTIINDLCSVMRAMPFYSVGSLTISQDRPTNTATNTSDPQYIFTNANVTPDGFTYSGIGSKTKFTEVEVSYFDNETQQLDFEYVSADDIAALSGYTTKFGKIRKTLKSFACTSRGQANRLARWFLYTNLRETETVSFTTTLEAGVVVRPQTIIGIADSLRAGVRRGGRIKAVNSTTEIVVDDSNNTTILDPTFVSDSTATLSIVMPDGSVETKSISSANGTTITVSSAYSTTPQVNGIFAIENSRIAFQTYRVLGIEEINHCEYKVNAIIHDTNKYSQVEDTTIPAVPRTITTLLDTKPAPANLLATERIVVLANRAVSKIFLSWEPVQSVKEYLLEFQYENDNPVKVRVAKPSFELFEARKGKYTFKIKSYNTLGKLSTNTATLTFNAIGKTELPSGVQNLSLETIDDHLVRLKFDPSPDIDVTHGGTVVVRASSSTTGGGFFRNAITLDTLSGNVTEAVVPNIRNGEYIVKFRDDGGRFSADEASVIFNTPFPLPKVIVLADREDLDSPKFGGAKTNCFFSDDVNGLVLDSTVLFDAVLDVDSIASFDFSGDVASSGVYEFANTLDLGGRQDINLTRHVVSQGFLPNDLIDARTANIETWTDFDGLKSEDVDAELLLAHTDSDPDTSVSATYAQSGTTITITKSSHGYTAGNFVTVNFTSGDGVDGHYEIQTVPSSSTFTLTASASQTTSGNCTYSAEFTQFIPFVNSTYTARGFKFKLNMTSNDPAQSIEIEQLGYTAELFSRTETSLTNSGATNGLIASGTSAKTVTFTDSFFTGQANTSIPANRLKPSVGITIENAEAGDFFKLTAVSGTAFTIEVKNRDISGNTTFVDRNFKYAASGFGRGS